MSQSAVKTKEVFSGLEAGLGRRKVMRYQPRGMNVAVAKINDLVCRKESAISWVVDFGLNGIGFVSDNALKVGDELTLDMEYQGIILTRIKARVVNVKVTGPARRVSVNFCPDDQERACKLKHLEAMEWKCVEMNEPICS